MELIASVKPDAFLRQKRNESEKTGMQESQKRIWNPENQELSFGIALLSWPHGFQIACLCPFPTLPVFMIKFISL
jgi:hypothetical protein